MASRLPRVDPSLIVAGAAAVAGIAGVGFLGANSIYSGEHSAKTTIFPLVPFVGRVFPVRARYFEERGWSLALGSPLASVSPLQRRLWRGSQRRFVSEPDRVRAADGCTGHLAPRLLRPGCF